MLEIDFHAPSMVTQIEVHMSPKIQSIWIVDGVKVQIMRSIERLDWDFMRSGKDSN